MVKTGSERLEYQVRFPLGVHFMLIWQYSLDLLVTSLFGKLDVFCHCIRVVANHSKVILTWICIWIMVQTVVQLLRCKHRGAIVTIFGCLNVFCFWNSNGVGFVYLPALVLYLAKHWNEQDRNMMERDSYMLLFQIFGFSMAHFILNFRYGQLSFVAYI